MRFGVRKGRARAHGDRRERRRCEISSVLASGAMLVVLAWKREGM
jgi:hypothetical protein